MPQIISADILGAEVEPREPRMFLKHQSAKGTVMHEVWIFQVQQERKKKVMETGNTALATCLERKPTQSRALSGKRTETLGKKLVLTVILLIHRIWTLKELFKKFIQKNTFLMQESCQLSCIPCWELWGEVAITEILQKRLHFCIASPWTRYCIQYLVAKQSLFCSTVRCSYSYLFSEWVRLGVDTLWCSQSQSKTVRLGN